MGQPWDCVSVSAAAPLGSDTLLVVGALNAKQAQATLDTRPDDDDDDDEHSKYKLWLEKRYVNTAIILIDQKRRRRINHKPNASYGFEASPSQVQQQCSRRTSWGSLSEFYEKLEAFMRRLPKRGLVESCSRVGLRQGTARCSQMWRWAMASSAREQHKHSTGSTSGTNSENCSR